MRVVCVHAMRVRYAQHHPNAADAAASAAAAVDDDDTKRDEPSLERNMKAWQVSLKIIKSFSRNYRLLFVALNWAPHSTSSSLLLLHVSDFGQRAQSYFHSASAASSSSLLAC